MFLMVMCSESDQNIEYMVINVFFFFGIIDTFNAEFFTINILFNV